MVTNVELPMIEMKTSVDFVIVSRFPHHLLLLLLEEQE